MATRVVHEIQAHQIVRRDSILEEGDRKVRKESYHTKAWLLLINNYASTAIALKHLISLESIMCIVLSVGFTCLVYFYTENNMNFDGRLSWVLLSFAVVMPMIGSIGMAYNRREMALERIATIRSTMAQLYASHAIWDWPDKKRKAPSGRKLSSVNWLEDYSDPILEEIILIGDDMTRYLALPSFSRARHTETAKGRQDASQLMDVGDKIFQQIVWRFGRLSYYVEIFKREGLPTPEAVRIRQWERIALENLLDLQVMKNYRTPQALRTFARVFSLLLPPFYAPYYAQLGKETGSLATGILFAIVAAFSLTALFETLTQMEDFFYTFPTLDGIHMHNEGREKWISQYIQQRDYVYHIGAPPFNEGLVEDVSQRRGSVPVLHRQDTGSMRLLSPE